MDKVYLAKGQSFHMTPAIVTLGEGENTKSLTLNHRAIYDKILTGLPVGDEIVVGKFEAPNGQIHPVIVEQGTGKYYYDASVVIENLSRPMPKHHKGKWYLGVGASFTLGEGAVVTLGPTATLRGAKFDMDAAIAIAGNKRDPLNVTDGISNGVKIGTIVGEDCSDIDIFFERFTERFYFYENEEKTE